MPRAALLVFIAGAGVAAWTGGTGSLPEFYDGWESDRGERNNREVPGRSGIDPSGSGVESPVQSQDPPPGGESGFVCSGVFACTLRSQGQTATVRVALQMRDGVCVAGDEVILEPGGIARGGGDDNDADETGTWTGSGNTLRLVVGGIVVDCVRTTGAADAPDEGDQDSRDPPSSGSGSTDGGGS